MGGAAILFVGLFLPLVSMPIVGSLNAFQIKDGIGAFVALPCIVAAFVLATKGKEREAAYAFGVVGVVLAVIFLNVQSTISEMKSSLSTELAGNPFRGIAERIADTVSLEWGWAILAIGLGMGLYGALAKPAVNQPPQNTPA